MDSRSATRDDQDAQEELHASTKQNFQDETVASLTHEEALGIREALASLDAGGGVPFDEAMDDLENFVDP